MSPSKRTLRDALWLIEGLNGSTAIRVRADIQRALTPKKSLAPAKQRRQARKKSLKERTAEVREAVFRRADGLCECTAGPKHYGDHLDHFRGGAHKRSNESVEGTWFLGATCHRLKTENKPSRLHWLQCFREHCLRHNYTREARETERLIDAEHAKAALPFRPGVGT